LGKAAVGSPYGAAGSIVVMTVWLYYSAQIFFFGAEFAHLYAHEVTGAHGHEPQRGETAERAQRREIVSIDRPPARRFRQVLLAIASAVALKRLRH
jgi:membrane protein